MPNFGVIRFRNARASGVLISQKGSGTYDHLGFFGPNGPTSAIEVGSYQDTTVIVDDAGSPNPSHGPFGGSGYLTNCKNTGTNTVRISGLPMGPYNKLINQVNIFEAANLLTEPRFRRIPSGTLLIEYLASGVSQVNTFNAKLYGFDETGAITDPAPDVTIVGFEINASGKFKNLAHSGVWHAMAGRDDALEFVDHSSAQGFRKRNRHLWVAAITLRADSVGVLDDFCFAFQVQFA